MYFNLNIINIHFYFKIHYCQQLSLKWQTTKISLTVRFLRILFNQNPNVPPSICKIFLLADEVWAKLNSLSKKVKSQEIKRVAMTIGRAPDNDIQILDKRLSGKHCKIMRKQDNEGRMVVVLEDSSSNGTYLNGQIVSNHYHIMTVY
jgi:hypothetical protein